MTENIRHLTPEQLLQWADNRAGIMRLNTDRDVLPGGSMAAHTPMLVAWPATEVYEEGATVVVRNVNYGGNPFERTTILHSVRLSLEDVEAVELILVPSRELGRRGPVHHVQIRYLFKAGKEPVLLNLAEMRTGTDARIPDLVLSWESWRSPDKPFNLREGLDESAYRLSLRAFAGAQRYLEDTIRQRKWYAYRLRLPGGQHGMAELLGVSLALGDGVARNTIAKILDEDEQIWLAQAPSANAASVVERWQALKTRLPREIEFEDRLPPIPEGETSYHALVRSCATLSRYLILLAAQRMVERGEEGDFNAAKLPEPTLGKPQPWMKEVASSDFLGIFMRAPAALRFLQAHPESVPSELPDELDAAGLLERRDGERVEIVYGRDETRPYGSSGIRRST